MPLAGERLAERTVRALVASVGFVFAWILI
jgi:hypothetical protein